MHKYSIENTVLVLTDSQRIKELLVQIKAERNLFKIYEADKILDVIAVPYFLCFIDISFLSNKETIDVLEEMFSEDDLKERPQMIVNGSDSTIPIQFRKYCKFINFEKIVGNEIKKIIHKKHSTFEGKRALEFKNKVKRLIDFYQNFEAQNKEDYISKNKVSESTYLRDFNLVRKIRSMTVNTEKLIRVERILLINKILNKDHRLLRDEFCKTHQISERTLSRDLKVLDEILNLSIEFNDGYYS